MRDQVAVDREGLRIAGLSFEAFAEEVGDIINDLAKELLRILPFTAKDKPSGADKIFDQTAGPALVSLQFAMEELLNGIGSIGPALRGVSQLFTVADQTLEQLTNQVLTGSGSSRTT